MFSYLSFLTVEFSHIINKTTPTECSCARLTLRMRISSSMKYGRHVQQLEVVDFFVTCIHFLGYLHPKVKNTSTYSPPPPPPPHTHTHTHAHKFKMQILLLPLSGHVSQCWQTPGAGLGACRKTACFSQHLVWALKVSPGPKLIHESSQLNLNPCNARYQLQQDGLVCTGDMRW